MMCLLIESKYWIPVQGLKFWKKPEFKKNTGSFLRSWKSIENQKL